MNKISTKSDMRRLFLFSFILLCCVFMSENTFSQLKWRKDNMEVAYSQDGKSIIFDFIFIDYNTSLNRVHSYMHTCGIYYSVYGAIYDLLMVANTNDQDGDMNISKIKLSHKKKGEQIQYLNSIRPKSEEYWSNAFDDIDVYVKTTNWYKGAMHLGTKRSYMKLKWLMPLSGKKHIKSINITGYWKIGDKSSEKFDEVYELDKVKPNSIVMKNIPSILNSQTTNNVKVSKNAGAIVVKGAHTGKKNKVYNASGVELKSVVANSDVLNIKLSKNQIY